FSRTNANVNATRPLVTSRRVCENGIVGHEERCALQKELSKDVGIVQDCVKCCQTAVGGTPYATIVSAGLQSVAFGNRRHHFFKQKTRIIFAARRQQGGFILLVCKRQILPCPLLIGSSIGASSVVEANQNKGFNTLLGNQSRDRVGRIPA